MHKALFVSGVDTDCGKTYVTAHLAAHLFHRGVRVVTQKPVQTGCDTASDDLVAHRQVMGTAMLPEDRERRTCTYLFQRPCSPHLAARLEGATIDPGRIDQDTAYLTQRYDCVLIEGAGGLFVPLTEELMTIDYVASRRLPLLLVATSHLGGINQALLSVEACHHHGVDLRWLVFNRFASDPQDLADDALEQISRHSRQLFPGLAVVDFRSADSFYGVAGLTPGNAPQAAATGTT